GRLMCCLKYEQEAYQDLLRTTPKVNDIVTTPEGKVVVIDKNLLTRKLTVRLDKDPEGAPKVFTADQVKVLRDGRVKLDKQELEQLKKLEQ
ncbi:MAG: stage 0 sporulation protein, partial [Acutalibacter sp.]|nr:stage 0 sporulation protein [Acutalibacter sp.]